MRIIVIEHISKMGRSKTLNYQKTNGIYLFNLFHLANNNLLLTKASIQTQNLHYEKQIEISQVAFYIRYGFKCRTHYKM
jgi:hypothetical protein